MTIVQTFVGMIKISVLARYLDSGDFGIMAIVTSVLGFMNLFIDMGLSTAILSRKEITDKEFSSLFWINIIFSVLLFFLISISSQVISTFFNEPKLGFLIIIMSFSILLSSYGRQFKTLEQKNLNFKSISLTEIISALTGLAFALYLAITGYGVFALIISSLVQQGVSNLIYLLNGLRRQRLLFHFNLNETKLFLRIGIYQVAGQTLNYFNREFDILIIGKFFGSDILGLYSLAKQLAQRPMEIINPIFTKVASPVLAIFQDDELELRDRFLSLLNTIATLNFFSYSLLVLFAYPAVVLFYGVGFTEIVLMVQLLSVYMFFRSMGDPIGSLLIAKGRTDLDFYWNLFALFVFPLSTFVGAQFSIIWVILLNIAVMIFLLYLSWYFLITKLCTATLFEYIQSLRPRLPKLIAIFRPDRD